MQKRAGLLYLAKNTGRVLLILEDSRWTLPTFERSSVLLEDAKLLFKNFSIGKVIPIELYLSTDKGFEYGTYICLVDEEFILSSNKTFAWCCLKDLPGHLHPGIKATLTNSIILAKVETILVLENSSNITQI